MHDLFLLNSLSTFYTRLPQQVNSGIATVAVVLQYSRRCGRSRTYKRASRLFSESIADSTFTNSVTLSSAVNYAAACFALRRELPGFSGGRLTSRLPSDSSDHPLSRRCRVLTRLIFRVGCGRRIRTSDLQGMNLLLYLAELSRIILVGGEGNAPRGNFISQQCQQIYSPPRLAPPENIMV